MLLTATSKGCQARSCGLQLGFLPAVIYFSRELSISGLLYYERWRISIYASLDLSGPLFICDLHLICPVAGACHLACGRRVPCRIRRNLRRPVGGVAPNLRRSAVPVVADSLAYTHASSKTEEEPTLQPVVAIICIVIDGLSATGEACSGSRR